jgi:nitroreductase
LTDNPTLRAIRERRSVNNFTSAPVTDQQLEAILEAGRWAPSALNSQPWDFVVVRDPQIRTEIGNVLRRITYAWRGFATAPALIVVSVDQSRDPEHFVEDGAVAAQNLCLAAQSLGLASSWAGIYKKRTSRKGVVHHDRFHPRSDSGPQAPAVATASEYGTHELPRVRQRRSLTKPGRFA